jgi:hypothetical protein
MIGAEGIDGGTMMRRYAAILAVLICAAGRGSSVQEPRVVELWPGKRLRRPAREQSLWNVDAFLRRLDAPSRFLKADAR